MKYAEIDELPARRAILADEVQRSLDQPRRTLEKLSANKSVAELGNIEI